MASVVTGAPTDGASLLALHKLDKRFDATHALKVVIGKGLNAASGSLASTSRRSAWTLAPRRNSIGRLPPTREGRGRNHDLVLPAGGLRSRRHPARLSRAGGLVASHGHKDATEEIILTEANGV